MTDEQLKKGLGLKYKIIRLREQIAYWENADSIYKIMMRYSIVYMAGSDICGDNKNFVDFDRMKTLTLQAMRTELGKLEKEYTEL